MTGGSGTGTPSAASSVPSSPYCTHVEVAYAIRQLTSAGQSIQDFSATTIPTDTEVGWFITEIASEMEAALAEAGYKLPLAVWSGETWPTWQTNLLKFLNVLGAAAIVTQALKPAPQMPTGREYDQDNVYSKRFNEMLDKLRVGKLRLRADCYASTLAERSLQMARAPMSDLGEGIIDGMDHLELREMTLLRAAVGGTWAGWGGAGSVSGYDWDTMRAWGKR